jgi:WD40 repeat protein/mono/diheme cytochrome c family protein
MKWSHRIARRLTAALAVSLVVAATIATAEEPPAAAPAKVSYWKDVRPIFQEHCQGCHQPAKAGGGLVLTSIADMLKPGESELPGLVPGKPDESTIVEQITPTGGEAPAMPKGRPALAALQIDLIRNWVTQGAEDDSPASGKTVVDAAHPPVYQAAPVISALDYSPDGQFLAVSGYHEVLLHKADGSELVARLIGLAERIESLAFSPDGKLLAVTGGSPGRFGEVQIWDVAERKLKLSQGLTYDTVYGVSWSPDGTRIAFGCADNTLRAIDVNSGQQVLYQGAHSDWVLDTVFSTDASHLMSVSRDRSMKLTEVATQRFVDNITSITPGALKGGLMTLDLRPGPQPADDQVICGGADGTPKLYKIYRTQARVIGDDFNLVRAYEAMPGRIYSVDFNVDGTRFVVGSSEGSSGEVRVYLTEEGKLQSKLEGQIGAVFAVAFRKDGKEVASGGFDGMVRLSDAETGKLVKEFVPAPLAPASGATASN